jgi:hypothetical protein
MKAWMRPVANSLAALAVIAAIVLVLNSTGDCAPEVTDCGESGRSISLLVLVFGLIGIFYYAYLLISARRRP